MKIIYFPVHKTYQDIFVYLAETAYELKEGKEKFASRWLTRGCVEITKEEAGKKNLKVLADPRIAHFKKLDDEAKKKKESDSKDAASKVPKKSEKEIKEAADKKAADEKAAAEKADKEAVEKADKEAAEKADKEAAKKAAAEKKAKKNQG